MPFTPEVREQIATHLREKATILKCGACGQSTWTLGTDIVLLPLQPNPKSFAVGGQSYPCIVLLCNTCGNTQLHNVLILGLGRILGVEPTET